MALIICKNLKKSYRLGEIEVPALRNINTDIQGNCLTLISGPSGSGKTTFLNLLGGLDHPDEGEIQIDGKEIQKMTDNELTDFRGRNIGFIFQNFNLIPVLNAYENVEYPLSIAGVKKSERKDRAETLLHAVGLSDKMHHLPGQLSGGQRQRVAIARALANSPKFVLADEPTANLDSQTGASIIKLMRKMQIEQKATFVISSHDPQMLAEVDNVIKIHDGKIIEIHQREFMTEAA